MESIASLDATVGALATLPGAALPPANLDVQAQEVLPTNTTVAEDAAALAAVALVTTAIHQHKRSLSQAAMGLVYELATQLEIERTLVVEGTVEQPLKHILQEHLVEIQAAKENGENEDIAALQGTLDQLESLIRACTNEYPSDKYLGRAPGFWTRPENPQGGHLETEWKTATTMLAYQTINCLQASAVNPKDGLPLPSPACAKEVYVQLQAALQERLAYLADKELKKAKKGHRHRRSLSQDYCSCVTTWWKGQAAPRVMVNQIMEQAMVQEASDFLNNNENFCLPQWNASYHPARNVTSPSKDLKRYSSPMRLISHRDIYMQLLVQALMAAKKSVMISTCYLFYQDPAQKYVLLDVLPLIASRGVKVYFMMDLFVFESNMLASPFQVQPKNKVPTSAEEHPLRKKVEQPIQESTPVPDNPTTTKKEVTEKSFLDCLPPEAPPAKKAYEKYDSQYHMFDELLQLSLDPTNNFELRFWCARDSTSGYRIKNHSKGMVIDDQWAVFGGSNVTPTIRSAFADLDCYVFGEPAKAVGDMFWNLWHAMDPTTERPFVFNENPALAPEHYLEDAANAKPCTFSLLQSTPSSVGEDTILRVVLEQIEAAQDSITISMGHCAYPQALVDALERAVVRGVTKIQCMVNSYHSNDLRCGQTDLFNSIRVLLERVPTAQVFATHCDGTATGNRPEFLHGKYVVVDGKWACLGSWNFWTRSSFYEMEMEAFCESDEVARHLQAKFDKEREANSVLVTLEDCTPGKKFCPKGCRMCKGFGPFFEGKK